DRGQPPRFGAAMAQTGRESAGGTLRPSEQTGIRRTGRSPLNISLRSILHCDVRSKRTAAVACSYPRHEAPPAGARTRSVTCVRNARPPSRARTHGTRRPPREQGRGARGANDMGALVRRGDDGVLVVARAHAAVGEDAVVGDPLEGLFVHLLGVGLEHEALARTPA